MRVLKRAKIHLNILLLNQGVTYVIDYKLIFDSAV